MGKDLFERKPDGWERSFDRHVKELKQALKDKETLKAFEERLTFLENSGKAKTTGSKEAHQLLLLDGAIGGLKIKDFLEKDQGRKHFAAYREDMKKRGYSDYTIAIRLGNLKIFVKWYCRENDLQAPKYLLDINSVPPQSKRVTEENVLSLEECKTLWQTSAHPRNQAMIAVAFESGMRLQELLNLRIGDLKACKENGKEFFEASFDVQKQKRKGKRITQALVWSAPYLFGWLLRHPFKENKLAWVFCNYQNQPERGAFPGAMMSKQTAHKVIAGIAKKAGIEKEVSFHRIRHAAITFELLHGGLNEPQVKAKHGYADKSNILFRYTHLTSKAVSEREKIFKGIGTNAQNGIKLPESIVCGRCSMINAEEAQLCCRCGFELDKEMRLKRMQGIVQAEDLFEEVLTKKLDAILEKKLDEKLKTFAH